MEKDKNVMILNDVNIGISKIVLDKSDLIIFDKLGKYCLKVYEFYNWKDMNNIKVGTREKIDFNEYCLSENNEPALIWPSNCYVEKISNSSLCFNLEFEDLYNTTTYMNQRGYFDIDLKNLKCKIFIDYKDVVNGSIIYNFL